MMLVISSMLMVNTTVNAQQSTKEAVHFMNNVNPAMIDSSYWLGNGGKDVLMTAAQIQNFNAVCKAMPETNMNDLINMPDTYDGLAIRRRICINGRQ